MAVLIIAAIDKLSGTKSPGMDNSIKIAEYFNISLDELSGREEKPTMSAEYDLIKDSRVCSLYDIPNILPIETKKIPVLGTVAAGVPILAEESFESYVDVGTGVSCDFALRVKGDSMINARIHDGDIVFIRKQDTVGQGEIAAVLIDDDATLKRFRRYGNHIVLQAENPEFQDIEFELGDDVNVRILGKAIAFQSDVR